MYLHENVSLKSEIIKPERRSVATLRNDINAQMHDKQKLRVRPIVPKLNNYQINQLGGIMHHESSSPIHECFRHERYGMQDELDNEQTV